MLLLFLSPSAINKNLLTAKCSIAMEIACTSTQTIQVFGVHLTDLKCNYNMHMMATCTTFTKYMYNPQTVY